MPSYFLDSSALVKGYRHERGTPRIQELLRGPDPLVISQLSHLEVSSAIVRRAKQSTESAEEITRALHELDREMAFSLEVIGLNDPLIVDAIRLTRTHKLRASDAIQLATSLVAHHRRLRQDFIFVSADLELNAAAEAEGLRVENPDLHSQVP